MRAYAGHVMVADGYDVDRPQRARAGRLGRGRCAGGRPGFSVASTAVAVDRPEVLIGTLWLGHCSAWYHTHHWYHLSRFAHAPSHSIRLAIAPRW